MGFVVRLGNERRGRNSVLNFYQTPSSIRRSKPCCKFIDDNGRCSFRYFKNPHRQYGGLYFVGKQNKKSSPVGVIRGVCKLLGSDDRVLFVFVLKKVYFKPYVLFI